MKNLVIRLIDLVLSIPFFFELQQRLCNDYTAVRNEFLDFVDVTGRKFLEVGCSTGAAAATIVDMKGNEFVGIDLDPKYAEKAGRYRPDGRFLNMDARRTTFADRYFDVILFVGVLHHMDDQMVCDCMNEVRRILKDDGRVLIGEPVFTPGWPLSNLLLALDRGRHIRDRAGYRQLLDGLDVEREGYFDYPPHRFCSIVLRKPRQ